MSKRATVKPDWLDAMLIGWALQGLRNPGWYSICPMLQTGIPTSAKSMEPMGVTSADYRELEEAIDALPMNHRCAIIRAYRPWTAQAMDAEYPDAYKQIWSKWLASAAAALLASMTREGIDNRN